MVSRAGHFKMRRQKLGFDTHLILVTLLVSRETYILGATKFPLSSVSNDRNGSSVVIRILRITGAHRPEAGQMNHAL